MASSYSGGVEGIGERIAELHRSIAKLGETRTNKRTSAITPYHPMPEERRQKEEWQRKLQILSRRQSERVRIRNELNRRREERETEQRRHQPSYLLQEFDVRNIDMRQPDTGSNKGKTKYKTQYIG